MRDCGGVREKESEEEEGVRASKERGGEKREEEEEFGRAGKGKRGEKVMRGELREREQGGLDEREREREREPISFYY